MSIIRKNDIAAVTVIIAASLLLMGKQIIIPGVHCCLREDAVLYIHWTRQCADMLTQGEFYPRWMPDAHGGYGTPTMLFYAPLVIYLTALFKLATSNMGLSIAIVKLTGVLLSGLFMYMFIRDRWGIRPGLIAALLYMYLPFRVFDLYFLGVFMSKFALAWFPLIMYFTVKAVREERMGSGTAGLAVTYALLCLTHIISAYMFAPVILSYGIYSAGNKRLPSAVVRIAAAAILGMSLAGFYLLPVAAGHNLVHLDTMPVKLWGQYQHNYPFFVLGPRSPYNMPFNTYLGRTIVASVLLTITMYAVSRRHNNQLHNTEAPYFIGIILATLFLMTDMSGFLWETVPGLKMVLFPTRWAVITVFVASCLGGTATQTASQANDGKQRRWIWLWAVPVLSILAWNLYLDFDIIKNGCVMTSAEIASFPKDMEVEEYVPKTVSLEWMRDNADNTSSPRVTALDKGAHVVFDIIKWGGQHRLLYTSSELPAAIRIRTFYFPGWRAYLDGSPVKIRVQPVTGAMLLDVPEGRHEIRLSFCNTPVSYAGWVLSVLSLGLTVLLARRRDYPAP